MKDESRAGLWRPVWALVVLMFLGGCHMAGKRAAFQPDGIPRRFERRITKTVGAQYLVYLPEDYGGARKKWPLLIFLHGAGERGDDIERVKIHGPSHYWKKRGKQPFIMIAPQCPEDEWWSVDVLDALLDEIVEEYPVDENRVYLTGLSMGGFATWDWASRRPYRFAALVPICGWGNPKKVGAIRDIPVWAFHGAKDDTVALGESEKMVDALRKAGGKAKFTVYPEAKHDSWTETYNNPKVYEWLLKQKRKSRTK